MLAISRALMSRPKLILFDEPSLGLAPKIVEQIFEIVAEIRKEGVTVIMVEQNAFAALDLCDRAYVLETGAIALEGPGRELSEKSEGAGRLSGRVSAAPSSDVIPETPQALSGIATIIALFLRRVGSGSSPGRRENRSSASPKTRPSAAGRIRRCAPSAPTRAAQ